MLEAALTIFIAAGLLAFFAIVVVGLAHVLRIIWSD